MSNILDTVLIIFIVVALIFLILVMIVGAAILLWFMITRLIDAIQERRERKTLIDTIRGRKEK